MVGIRAGFSVNRKFLAVATSAILAATGLVVAGESPAMASTPTVLPDDARTGNTSGVVMTVCPNGFYDFWAPVPAAVAPDDGAPNESQYARYVWDGDVEIGGASRGTFTTTTNTSNPRQGLRFITSASGTLTGVDLSPGDVLNVTLGAIGTPPNTTFGNTLDTPHSRTEVTGHTVTVLSPPAGSGTRANPYKVTNFQELNFLRCAQTAFFELQNDIDMSPSVHGYWLPAGLVTNGFDGKQFRGVLDGKGHVLSNFQTPLLDDGYVGLFSRIADLGQVVNITLRGARVVSTGRNEEGYAGVLAGSIDQGIVKNVVVESSHVEGPQYVGLVTGGVNNSSTLKYMTVSGEVTTPNVWTRSYLAQVTPCIFGASCSGTVPERTFQMPSYDARFGNRTLRDIGGFMGVTSSGIHGLVSHITLDADIKVPNRQKPDGAGPQYVNTGAIAGFVGDVDGEVALFSFIESSATIDVIADGSVSHRDFGGFVGESDNGAYSDISSFVVMNVGLQTTGTPDAFALQQVGGFVGDVSKSTFTRVRSLATINIEALDDKTGYGIEDMGGFGGEIDNGILSAISSDASVTVSLPGAIGTMVGGFIGDENGDVVITDSLVQSSFDFQVAGGTPSLTEIGGLTGRSENESSGNSIIVAATFNFDGVTPTDFDPVVGVMESDSGVGGAFVCTFYDTTLNPEPITTVFFDSSRTTPDPGNPTGSGATTVQLQDRAFLEDCFDFDNAWLAVDGDYPTPRQAVFLTSTFDSSVSGLTLSPLPVLAAGSGQAGGAKALAATGLSLGWTALFAGMLFLLGTMMLGRRSPLASGPRSPKGQALS